MCCGSAAPGAPVVSSTTSSASRHRVPGPGRRVIPASRSTASSSAASAGAMGCSNGCGQSSIRTEGVRPACVRSASQPSPTASMPQPVEVVAPGGVALGVRRASRPGRRRPARPRRRRTGRAPPAAPRGRRSRSPRPSRATRSAQSWPRTWAQLASTCSTPSSARCAAPSATTRSTSASRGRVALPVGQPGVGSAGTSRTAGWPRSGRTARRRPGRRGRRAGGRPSSR